MSYRIKEIYSHGQPSKYKAQKKYFNLVWITLKTCGTFDLAKWYCQMKIKKLPKKYFPKPTEIIHSVNLD
jgi:hypothetical protein